MTVRTKGREPLPLAKLNLFTPAFQICAAGCSDQVVSALRVVLFSAVCVAVLELFRRCGPNGC